MSHGLGLKDISDLRAYERERPEFLKEVIALKAIRRLAIGPFLSVVFENRTTVRFQIQEMARAEKMLTDQQIQTELDVYNVLVPERFEVSMTMFIELTTDDDLRTWLPRLVGIESAIAFRIGASPDGQIVPAEVEPGHASQLSRDDVTASVHYLKAVFAPDLAARFATEPVAIVAGHEAYHHETLLPEETKVSITADWADA